jgi:hypothetical protein
MYGVNGALLFLLCLPSSYIKQQSAYVFNAADTEILRLSNPLPAA